MLRRSPRIASIVWRKTVTNNGVSDTDDVTVTVTVDEPPDPEPETDLSVTVSGPTSASNGDTETYTVTVTGGSGLYGFVWSIESGPGVIVSGSGLSRQIMFTGAGSVVIEAFASDVLDISKTGEDTITVTVT